MGFKYEEEAVDFDIGGNCSSCEEELLELTVVIDLLDEEETISFFIRTMAGQLGALFFTTTDVDLDIFVMRRNGITLFCPFVHKIERKSNSNGN